MHSGSSKHEFESICRKYSSGVLPTLSDSLRVEEPMCTRGLP
jgi:hypothetical protein